MSSAEQADIDTGRWVDQSGEAREGDESWCLWDMDDDYAHSMLSRARPGEPWTIESGDPTALPVPVTGEDLEAAARIAGGTTEATLRWLLAEARWERDSLVERLRPYDDLAEQFARDARDSAEQFTRVTTLLGKRIGLDDDQAADLGRRLNNASREAR
ncbi:MAG: hypothetical protein REI11_18040 [Patulibacter sp.]|nr:hypothetical protein [Patulibacter sp.]